jgi:serine/threonine protein kinase
MEKFLSAGGFGEVYLCERRTVTGERMVAAVKVVNPTHKNAAAAASFLRKEFDLLKRVSSPYVAPVVDSGYQEVVVGRTAYDIPWVAVQYVPGRSLQEEIVAEGVLNEAEWLDLAHDLLSAVAATHEVGLVNSDIKPTNIMRSSRKTMIIDLGGANVYGVIEGGASNVYSFGYSSPEQLDVERTKPLGYESDIFSIGATLVFAATGLTPWNYPSSNGGAKELRAAHTIVMTEKPRLEGLSNEQKDLVKKLIDIEPRMRLSAADALSQVRAAMAPGNPRKTGDVTFERVRSVAQWVRPKESKKPRAQSLLAGFLNPPTSGAQSSETPIASDSTQTSHERVGATGGLGSRVRPQAGTPVVGRMLTTVFLSVFVPIIGPAARFLFLENEQRPDYVSRMERNIAVTFFSWGTLGIGGAIVARRWYASTKKRFHLVTGIVNAAGCAAFFSGVPLAGANETLGATLTFLGFLAIAATPLVQISRAPVAGEEPPEEQSELTSSDEPK